ATLKELISQTMVRWSQEDQIQDPELVRIMYNLLRRQYDSIGELLQALRKAYTISTVSVKDTINLLAALGQIRSLLSVRMGKEEELLMINGLGYGINVILFLNVSSDPSTAFVVSFCCCFLLPGLSFFGIRNNFHPALLPIFTPFYYLVLILSQSGHFSLPECLLCAAAPLCLCLFGHRAHMIFFKICSRLSSRQATINFRVVTYLAGCGLQSCPVLLAKGYPDIGWNPIEGERYLSFLRFAVFVN
ncbi:RYR3 protein, partial [Bucorvus abyssinicus]|nr:RYR3 protein [Bucorvus abyssinicus]